MGASEKRWNGFRQLLWLIGVLNLLVLLIGWFLNWFLQGGFGPGKQTLKHFDLTGTILLSVPCIYYIVVAHYDWSRTLWRVGIAVHCLLLAIFLMSFLASGGRSAFVLPLVLPGPVTWLLYAKRNRLRNG